MRSSLNVDTVKRWRDFRTGFALPKNRAKYVLGKHYNVEEHTIHGHAATWQECLRIIEEKGYIQDFVAEAICKRHKNPLYFEYVVENGWLVPMNKNPAES